MQRVARLLEFLGKGAAQALGGLAEVIAQAVALLRQAAVQIVEHLRVWGDQCIHGVVLLLFTPRAPRPSRPRSAG